MMTDRASKFQCVTGTVQRGQGRGRALGFPTANLELARGSVLPASGIYAAWAEVAGYRYAAAVHVGPVPTFGQAESTVEAHILDYPDQDLYGQSMELCLVEKLRDVERFETTAELVAALQRDCEQTRELLRTGR